MLYGTFRHFHGGKHPDTILSTLVRELWREAGGGGGSAETPILVRPLVSCPESYSKSALECAASFYAGGRLTLPPRVEIEELLSVLDYFGISVSDALSVSLDAVSVSCSLRARCLLAEQANFDEAKEEILKELDPTGAPRREYHFLALKAGWSLEYLNASGAKTYLIFGQSINTLEKHMAWTKSKFFSDKMVAELEDEGLATDWKYEYVAVNGSDEDYMGFREEVKAHPRVLNIKLPEPESLEKRRKLDP